MENFKELARLTNLYHKNVEQFDFLISTDLVGKFHVNERDILNTFPKEEIESANREYTGNYPYEISVTISGIKFYAILSGEEFKEHFPERIETEIEKLERKLAELKGVAST